MSEMLVWFEAVTLAALSEFIRFMSQTIAAPLWLLMVTFLVGALSTRARSARGGMSRAYQRIKVRWQR